MSLLKRLKDNINYYRAAAPNVVAAYSKKLIGDVASNEEQEFRKSQCETCPLFNGTNCNKNSLASRETGLTYSLNFVETSGMFVTTSDQYKVLRTASREGQTFVRGCGCPLTGTNAKWKFEFEDKDLLKTDGTAPCPLNRWVLPK